ncbi:MAG: hypothetical protein LBN38_05950 [Verrucomicrobiota bacterium]|jgi:hypothetical protein|nr:hypothetical protein [Verrucomicrobiota bacterium]
MSKETSEVIWNWKKADEVSAASPPSKTKYGVQLAVMVAIGALFYFGWHKEVMAYVVWGIGALLLFGLLLSPAVLRGFDRAGGWLVWAVGTSVTWLLLTPVFYLFFTLGHLWQKMSGKDPLHRKWDVKAATYWNDHDTRNLETRYQKQF